MHLLREARGGARDGPEQILQVVLAACGSLLHDLRGVAGFPPCVLLVLVDLACAGRWKIRGLCIESVTKYLNSQEYTT